MPIFEAAAARRSSRITKSPARRRTVLETTPTGRRSRIIKSRSRRSAVFEAAAASITEAAATGPVVVAAAKAAARVARPETASRAVVATEAAARRPVVGPGAAAAPVARTVGRRSALALLSVGRLGLGRALGAEAFRFGAVPGDLCGAALLVLATCVEIN